MTRPQTPRQHKKSTKHPTSAGLSPTLAPAQAPPPITGSPPGGTAPVVATASAFSAMPVVSSTTSVDPTPVTTTPATGLPSTGTTTPPALTAPATPPPASLPSVVDPPPDGVIPSPPVGFVEANPKEFQGCRPKAAQVGVSPLVVTELTSSPTYGDDLGPTAPPARMIASAVNLAYRWRLIRNATEAWLAYVRTQDGLAWRDALALVTQLEPFVLAAVTRDPSVAAAYPGLMRMFDAPKVIARTASATKKKAAKTKAQNAVTTAVNAALAHAAQGGGEAAMAATPATTTAPQGATSPARVVTVTG